MGEFTLTRQVVGLTQKSRNDFECCSQAPWERMMQVMLFLQGRSAVLRFVSCVQVFCSIHGKPKVLCKLQSASC